MIKIGIIREWKEPADRRAVLTPKQYEKIMSDHPLVKIKVESSPDRAFTNEEYIRHGVEVLDNISDCDIMLGVKEVPTDKLIENKTYFFFSHTIKKQPYNQKLMRALIEKEIRMIDFELLTKDNGKRIIGFGNFAGKVGAYNGLLTYGKKHKIFELTPAYKIDSYKGIVEEARRKIKGDFKIVLTGTGRVGQGAYKFLNDVGIEYLAPKDFLKNNHKGILFTQLGSIHLYERISDGKYIRNEFHSNPELYKSSFGKFIPKTDLLINGIFWNEKMPRLFLKQEINKPDFRISSIADISCDVEGSVPVTYKTSSIYDPVFGVDRKTFKQTDPFLENTIDLMTVTNLPTELARDASTYFGKAFMMQIIPEIMMNQKSEVLNRATICKGGKLNNGYEYLKEYAGL